LNNEVEQRPWAVPMLFTSSLIFITSVLNTCRHACLFLNFELCGIGFQNHVFPENVQDIAVQSV
jgi:hypothetical protein